MRSGEGTPGPSVAAVVLAAGRSTRMGQENKLLRIIDGVPMICRAVDPFLDARVGPIVVVTGHEAELVEAALGDRPVSITRNEAHAEGMGSSLRLGVSALPKHVGCVLVGLGDMPWVRAEHIDALVDAFEPSGRACICVPMYRGQRGNPVLWPQRYFQELRALEGDAGARSLLARYSADVSRVEVGDPGVLLDVDTPDVLSAWSR